MPALPTIIPNPTQNYSASADPSLAVVKFEKGFRQRRQYSRETETIDVEWSLTQLQLDVLEKFVEKELSHGSLPFSLVVAGLDGLRTVTAYLIGGKLQKSYVPHAYWFVRGSLVVEPPARMTDEVYELLKIVELENPGEFVSTSNWIYLYIENHYGQDFPMP